MFDYTFLNKEFFWFLLLIPVAIIWYIIKRKQQQATLKMSSLEGFKSQGVLPKLKHFLFLL